MGGVQMVNVYGNVYDLYERGKFAGRVWRFYLGRLEVPEGTFVQGNVSLLNVN